METDVKTIRPIIVRTANEFDSDMIISLGRAMHRESPRFRKDDFNVAKCQENLKGLTADGGVFIAEKGEEAVGCMVTMLCEHYFGKTTQALDLFLYVKPDYRGSRAAYLLIKSFEGWARENKAGILQLGITAEIGTEQVRRFYEKMGYKVTGYVTVKEV